MLRSGPRALLLPRVIGALSLRPGTFREVARDPAAGVQAGILVVVDGIVEASVDAAIHEYAEIEMILLLGWVLAALIGWLLWAAVLWFVGSRIFHHEVDFPAVARAVAFAHAPSLLYGIAAVPELTPWAGLVYVGVLLWFTAALHAATRGIYDVPPREATRLFLVALCFRVVLLEVLPYTLRLVPGATSRRFRWFQAPVSPAPAAPAGSAGRDRRAASGASEAARREAARAPSP